MIKPIVQTEILSGWRGVDPETYFGFYDTSVAIQIDPYKDPEWIDDKEIYKVAVQAEPPSVMDGSVERYLRSSGNKYDLILTYFPEILREFENSRFVYVGGTWICNQKSEFNKNRLLSFITSNKNFTSGHHLRMEVVDKLSGRFDLYGRGFNEIDNKDTGLDNYMFSIAIENISMKNYFTEKINDCFLTKTIPIYYGCTNISDFYDARGIIKISDLGDLERILDSLTIEHYSEMLPYVEANFTKALSEIPYNKRIEYIIKEEIKKNGKDKP